MFKSVSDIIQEGAILQVEKFKIQDKTKSSRPIDYKYKISFDENSIIKPTDEEIIFPPPKFTFLDFKDIPSKLNDKADLTDAIGFWCKSSETRSKNTKIGTTDFKDINIVDNDGNMLRIAFWGETVKQVPDIILGTELQNVIIVTSTYVSIYEDGYCLQSTQATKAYVNLDIVEVTAFRNRGSKQPEKKIMTPSRKRINTIFEKQGVDEKKSTIKDIMAAVRAVSSKDVYSCTATITKLHKTRGWYYISCRNCLKVVKWNVDGYKCLSCKDIVDRVERYKIQFEIEDDTGCMDVTVFTEIAEDLIGYPFDSMVDVSNEGNGDDVYELIENNIIGKQINFNLKITDYNRKFPTSSLTATKVVKIAPVDWKKAKYVSESKVLEYESVDGKKPEQIENEVVADNKKSEHIEIGVDADDKKAEQIDKVVGADSKKTELTENEVVVDIKKSKYIENEVATDGKKAKHIGRKARHIQREN